MHTEGVFENWDETTWMLSEFLCLGTSLGSCLYQHEILKPLAVIGKNRISDFILRSTTRLKFPSSEVS